MANPEQIIAAIVGRAKTAPEVMGAHLGMAVKRAVPDADLRQYGGLRRFIQVHCGDSVQWVRKHGLDDVYALNPKALPEGTAQDSAAVGAWQALSNPTSSYVAYVNPTDGSLTVLPAQAEPAVGLVLVPKISSQEHRGIAQGFLQRIDPNHRGAFEEVLRVESFWPAWVRQTRTFGDGIYKNEWMSFRTDRIFDLLKSKLTGLGLDSTLAESVLKKVRESKELPAGPGSAGVTRYPGVSGMPGRRGFRETEIKRLAHQAIDIMGENEVRKLRIPLGVVVDALRAKHP